MVVCPTCSLDNESYARFCIECGGSLASQKTSPCLNCGKSDVVNDRFCIGCGAEQSVKAVKVKRFTWTSESDGREARRLIEVVGKENESRLRSSILISLACGIAFGVLIFSFLKSLQNLQTLPLFGKIPPQGLVVYCQQPAASVLLKRVSDSSLESVFYLGEADRGGSFSIVDLAPGDYIAQVSAPGKLSALQNVSLSDKTPTVLGYPQKIELPEDND